MKPACLLPGHSLAAVRYRYIKEGEKVLFDSELLALTLRESAVVLPVFLMAFDSAPDTELSAKAMSDAESLF